VSGSRPQRSLGQNFLVDPNTQRRIIAAADLTGAHRIVEIGPGQGAITEGLLELGLPLVVIEKDTRLAAQWSRRAEGDPRLTAVQGDALKIPLERFGPPQETVVVGNIPYNVTTPLIFHLLQRPRPRELVLMVQKEVADRLAAEAGTAAYGALSVGVQVAAQVERLFSVPRTVFRPRPKVDSAVVRIRPLAPPPLTREVEVRTRDLVRACFGWRRKQLGTTLRKHPDLEVSGDDLPAILERVGCTPTARAETLTPQQFVALAQELPSRD
jgi:16S rRNA (adenine1518-N6/adenine1519-N6)-dimethyltransferase